jgi:F420H(2)-dependent biliverdin reductase
MDFAALVVATVEKTTPRLQGAIMATNPTNANNAGNLTSTERFRTEPNVWLGTTRADGRPHLVPIWFVWVHERVWIATDAKSVKIRNIAANPFATVALEDGNKPIVAEGTAVVHSSLNTAELTGVRAEFVRKYQWDIGSDSDGPVVIEITPTKWLFPSSDATNNTPPT